MSHKFIFIRQLVFYWLLLLDRDATGSRPHGWCQMPGPPLRITKAFYYDPKIGSLLSVNNYIPTLNRGDWYREGSLVFVGCVDGYTATTEGSLMISCVTNQSSQTSWNGSFPTCKRNVCWWCAQEETVEFRHGTRSLTDQTAGFPEGTTVRWICPDGMVATNSSLQCLPNGLWDGEISICVQADKELEGAEWNNAELFISFFFGAITTTVLMFAGTHLNGIIQKNKGRRQREHEPMVQLRENSPDVANT